MGAQAQREESFFLGGEELSLAHTCCSVVATAFEPSAGCFSSVHSLVDGRRCKPREMRAGAASQGDERKQIASFLSLPFLSQNSHSHFNSLAFSLNHYYSLLGRP